MRFQTAAILIFVLISALCTVAVLSTLEENTILSTSIDLNSLYDGDDDFIQEDYIYRAVDYVSSLASDALVISHINNEAVALTELTPPRALYPGSSKILGSSSITLQWDASLLKGAPDPFAGGSFLGKMTLSLEYLSLGTTLTTVIIQSFPQPTFDLKSNKIDFFISPSTTLTLTGTNATFRLRYESVAGVKDEIVTKTPQYFFIAPTCFVSDSFQIGEGSFSLYGKEQCQNGSRCNMVDAKCRCEALWPTYFAADTGDRCALSADKFITCNNGGKVTRGDDDRGIWQCDCVNGFFGKFCDSSPDCAKAMVCYNQGFVAKDPVTQQCAAQCTCQTNWINNVCDTCSFRCLNGGRQNKGCSSCACAQGYSGTNCQCRQISFSMTLTSVPSAILDAYDSSSATADVFILDWFAAQLSTNVQSSATSSPITSNNLAITTMTIDTTLEPNNLKSAGYVLDNCQESVDNNNFASIRDTWNTFTEYIKETPLDIDGTPYPPVDVVSISIDAQCDELYSNPADDPDCFREPLVERKDASEENLSIFATPNSLVFITFTMGVIFSLLF